MTKKIFFPILFVFPLLLGNAPAPTPIPDIIKEGVEVKLVSHSEDKQETIFNIKNNTAHFIYELNLLQNNKYYNIFSYRYCVPANKEINFKVDDFTLSIIDFEKEFEVEGVGIEDKLDAKVSNITYKVLNEPQYLETPEIYTDLQISFDVINNEDLALYGFYAYYEIKNIYYFQEVPNKINAHTETSVSLEYSFNGEIKEEMNIEFNFIPILYNDYYYKNHPVNAMDAYFIIFAIVVALVTLLVVLIYCGKLIYKKIKYK